MMRKQIDKILGNFLALLMGIMTLDVLWGVFTRYAMGNQSGWSEELARFLLIWIGILGAAYAAGQDMHLSIELLMPKLQKKSQIRLKLLISFLIAAFAFTVMVIGGGRLMYITQVLGQLSPALRVPMAVVYSVAPLSGILVIYYKASDVVTLLQNK
ncbi:MAG: TRAP transporter small permease [Lewinellaceae bacterium]|nr:TRAP transporter small permease [Lewinellaceae bacterium]